MVSNLKVARTETGVTVSFTTTALPQVVAITKQVGGAGPYVPLKLLANPANETHSVTFTTEVASGDLIQVGSGSPTDWEQGTVPAKPSPTPEPPAPEPTPPPPPASAFRRGMCAGGWTQSQEVADAKKLGSSPTVRLENPGSTSPFTSAGVDVIYLNSGGTSVNSHFTPEARMHRSAVLAGRLYEAADIRERFKPHRYGYSSGGIRSLNAATVAADAVAVLKKHPDVWAYELLNEPGGNWFWGPGAESQENATAYCKLIREVHAALVANNLARPLIVSFDGGHAGDNTWGRRMLAADPTLFQIPEVIPSNHPYDGGGSTNPASTLVHWGSCEETHRLTGKWPAITEYGRPLESGRATRRSRPKLSRLRRTARWSRRLVKRAARS